MQYLLEKMTVALLLAATVVLAGLPLASGADPAAPREGPDRPKIVRLDPPDGAIGVDPATELHIRFDRPMDPTRAAFDWKTTGEAGYRLRGEMRYVPETHEFTLPVYLTPGRKHEVTTNREGPFRKVGFEGFRSVSGIEAASATWSFTTAQPTGAGGGPPPRIVSVTPPVDTEVALFTPLEVTFDQPMNPAPYGLELSTSGPEPFMPDRRPKIQGRVDYEERTHRFTLLMKLPAHWNGEFRLEGFRGANGVAAGPVTLKYRTLRQPLSPALRQKIDQAGQGPAPELRRIVESVQRARRDLKSVSEQVLTTMSFGSGSDWHQRYDLRGSRFRMQGDRKFVGDIDAIMRIPFRVGSDGTTCWLVRSNELIEVPFDQIEQKDLLFCDPFDATGATGVDRLVRDRKLQYLGETIVRGRRCHLIRSNDIHLVTTGMLSPMIQWSIDAETFLPARVEMDDTVAMDYLDVHINEPISDEEFRPQVGPDARRAEQEPLDEGYTRRFLKVNDGTGGRMSVRWGMTGPKGKSSSGLN